MTGHIDVALDTAAAGWPVFPCGTHKKPAITKCGRCDNAGARPGTDAYLECAATGRTGHGLYDATTDPDRIRAWWQAHPANLVGTPTDGLVVVDLDEPTSGPTGDAWAWWTATAGARGWHITDAPIVVTPRGGLHIYYRQPDSTDVRNSASKLAAGVDIRANGGYVIAPGSVLPDGRCYELLDPPAEVPDAPAWLLELIAAATAPQATHTPTARPDGHGGTRYGLGALEAELGRLALAPDGQRNDTLVRAAYRAGQLVAGGELDPHHAIDHLLSVALRIGLGEGEAHATIASGLRSGARTPRRRAA